MLWNQNISQVTLLHPSGGKHSVSLLCAMIIPVDILKMLAELRTERAAIEEAMVVLERIAHRRGKRGRMPKWITDGAPPAPPKTYTHSPAVRARMASAQRKRWAKRKRTSGV